MPLGTESAGKLRGGCQKNLSPDSSEHFAMIYTPRTSERGFVDTRKQAENKEDHRRVLHCLKSFQEVAFLLFNHKKLL